MTCSLFLLYYAYLDVKCSLTQAPLLNSDPLTASIRVVEFPGLLSAAGELQTVEVSLIQHPAAAAAAAASSYPPASRVCSGRRREEETRSRQRLRQTGLARHTGRPTPDTAKELRSEAKVVGKMTRRAYPFFLFL